MSTGLKQKTELLDAIVREFVLKIPPHKLIKLLSGFGWTDVFDDYEDDSYMSVLDAALNSNGDVTDFQETYKPYLGEALAKVLGAKEVIINW